MKNMKKSTAILLCALMVASVFSGCNQETNSSSGATSDSSTTGSSTTESSTAENTPVTLTGWGSSTFDGTTGIKSYSDQLSWKELEKKTGIHVDWTIVSNTNGNNTTQFGLMMASGELPDFFVGVNPMNLEEFGMKGALMPLEDLIASDIPSLQAAMDNDPTVKGGMTSADGHIYFFPRILGDVGTRCWAGWMIRQDWLDQVGMEVPDNTDDLYNVLKAFKEEIGAEKPLTGDIKPIVWAFGVGSRGSGNNTDDMFLEDGEIKFGPTDPRYREALEYLNKLYNEGLLDPEWNGITTDQITTNIVTGLSGVDFGSFSGHLGTFNNLFTQDDGTAPLVAMKPLAGPDGTRAIQGMHNSIDPSWAGAISISTEKAADVARLFEYTYGEYRYDMYFGVEGDTYTIVDGVPTYTEKVTTDKLGTMQYINNYIFDLSLYPSDYPLEVYQSILTEEGKRGNQITTENCGNIKVPALRYTAEEIDRVNTLLRDINTYVDENFAAFVNGQKSFSEWESYMAGFDSLGLDELLKIYNDSYQRFLAAEG